MNRRPLVLAFARMRAAIRRRLPASVESATLLLWNRAQGKVRRARADVVLISYPKAGRTWLRWMIGRSLQLSRGIEGSVLTDLEAMHDVDPTIPRIWSTHDGILPTTRSEEVRRDKRRYRRKDVLLLVRDPRDLLVSGYHHQRHRGGGFDGELEAFARQEASGIDTILRFHEAWSDALDVPRRLHLIRYEDLVRAPADELRAILRFLRLDVGDAVIAQVVEEASFERMQRDELRGSADPTLRTPDASNPSARKVRRGVVSGHRDELRAETVEWLDAKVRSARLGRFGYR